MDFHFPFAYNLAQSAGLCSSYTLLPKISLYSSHFMFSVTKDLCPWLSETLTQKYIHVFKITGEISSYAKLPAVLMKK
jgi:hypothetical protein